MAALGAATAGSLHAASGNTNTPEDLFVLVHDANAVAMPVANTGQLGNDLFTGNGRGVWPSGTPNNYVFGMGVWIGGIADLDGDGTKDTVTVLGYDTLSGGTEHAEGRVGQDTSDPLARVFSSTIIEDLIDWPDEFRDPQGDPIVYSSQDFVTIYNDISGEPSYEAGRCGIEIKQRSMAFVGGLNFNTILVFYEITNRSDSLPDGPYTLEEASIAFVSDMDIGDEFADDMTSVLDSVDVYGRGTVGLNTGIAWDKDFNETGWEGKVGFVGVHLLQPPGNHWDSLDNDGDGFVDESPFNGIDDDLDGIIDDIPDEVDTVDDFRYSWFDSPSTGGPINDPITDSGAYRMMMCLTEDDCGEFDIASDIRFLISSGDFDLPPGESQIAGFAIVFANPVGDPDHLDLYGDPPRPDPQDSVLSELVATILSTRTLYESGFEDLGAIPFLIYNTTELETTNDPGNSHTVYTNILDSIPLARNTLHHRVDGGFFDETVLSYVAGNTYSADIPAQPFWSEVSYYIQAVDSAFQVMRDPRDAPVSTYDFEVVDVPSFSSIDCPECDNGVAIAPADFDQDGLVDILILKEQGPVLLRNTGDLTFEDVTTAAGLTALYFAKGTSWGDYDNDGYPDLFIATYFPGDTHILYRNLGDGTFDDVTIAAGVADSIPASSGVWGDINNDGLLDLLTIQLQTDRLYINKGDGTFEDRAQDWGIGETSGDRSGTLFDIDGDGDLDLLLTGGGENFVYRNTGEEQFTDITSSSGIADVSWNSVTVGDYDGDGDSDVLFSGSTLTLYENVFGAGTFADVTELMGLHVGAVNDAALADLNADGLLDVITTQPSVFIRRHNSTFVDLTETSGIPGNYAGQFVLSLDLNKDGRQDLVMNDFHENTGYAGTFPKHWLELALEGTISNRMAAGSRVRLYADELSSTQWVSGGEGKSQDGSILYFGLNTIGAIDSLVINWPSGATQKLENLPVDSLFTVIEDSTLGIGDPGSGAPGIPHAFTLSQNYPNPFNPLTVIAFDIPGEGSPAPVRTKLEVFDVRGRLVTVLLEDDLAPGRYSVQWNGRSDRGETMSSGIYFYRLDAGSFYSTRKMMLLK